MSVIFFFASGAEILAATVRNESFNITGQLLTKHGLFTKHGNTTNHA